MKPSFVAGFGPIVRDVEGSRAFWGGAMGITFEELAPNYWTTEKLDGVKVFALWPLSQAAEACFGSPMWPDEIPAPQAWIEIDVASPEAVNAAVAELEAAGQRMLHGVRVEPWGQTTAHLLSPEGLLAGVTYTPSMHGTGG